MFLVSFSILKSPSSYLDLLLNIKPVGNNIAIKAVTVILSHKAQSDCHVATIAQTPNANAPRMTANTTKAIKTPMVITINFRHTYTPFLLFTNSCALPKTSLRLPSCHNDFVHIHYTTSFVLVANQKMSD